MAVTLRHSIYAVQIDPSGTPVVLGAIGGSNIRTGTELRSDVTSGQVYPTHQAIVAQKPGLDFSTHALQDALDVIGLTGKALTTANGGINCFGYKHAEGGGRASGSAHRKYAFNEGLLVPRRISCDHQQDAVLAVDGLITYDGTNEPIAITDSSAVPSGVTDNERFTIGPITIGGVTIPQVKSFEVDFGLQAETEGADSDRWDTFASIVQATPMITLRGINIEWLKSNAVPLTGLVVTHANTSLYLRKRSTGSSGFVANATTQHIKITCDGLAYVEDAFTAEGDRPAETSIMIPCRYDGTNAPLVINTAIAIT
jgi:hypothetical protein